MENSAFHYNLLDYQFRKCPAAKITSIDYKYLNHAFIFIDSGHDFCKTGIHTILNIVFKKFYNLLRVIFVLSKDLLWRHPRVILRSLLLPLQTFFP